MLMLLLPECLQIFPLSHFFPFYFALLSFVLSGSDDCLPQSDRGTLLRANLFFFLWCNLNALEKFFFGLNRKETIGSEENSSQKISKTFNTDRIIRQTFVASSFTTRRKKMREKESRFLPISAFGCFGTMKKDDDEGLIFWQQLKDVCAFCLLPLVP